MDKHYVMKYPNNAYAIMLCDCLICHMIFEDESYIWS